MKLFDYQEELVEDIRKQMRQRKKRIIAQLSTGGGKTPCIASIAARIVLKGGVVCVTAHREEIFRQIFKTLMRFGIKPGIIAPGTAPMPGSQVYLAMAETVYRRMNKGLIKKLNINSWILDETHVGNYYKLINEINDLIIGFTATPKSTGSPHLKEYFDAIVCGVPLKYLIGINRLVPARTFAPKHDFSKVKRKGNDYDESAMFAEFKKPVLREGALQNYLLHAKGLRAICYNINVEHSIDTCNLFREAGIRAAHVDGRSDTETRQSIFRMFESGEIDVVHNVGIATAGYDFPGIRCTLQNFATMSLPKHWQTIGRGARWDDDSQQTDDPKLEFINIDMGNNYLRHGKFHDAQFRGDDVDWVDIFNNPATAVTKEETKRTNRSCDECGFVMAFRQRTCPSCGEFISEQQLEEKILTGATTEEIRAYKHSTLPVSLRKPIEVMTDMEIHMFGKHMNYDRKWAWRQIDWLRKKRKNK